jgi:hypothetical protein
VPNGISYSLHNNRQAACGFGPTASTRRATAESFYRITFGNESHRWHHRSIDSRTAARSNKAQIAEWIGDYGIDSDFVRVRVLGLPSAASELQFIDFSRVQEARKRTVETLPDEPLIAGFDVSGGGAAWNVIRFRRGQDGRSIPPIRIPGEKGRDRSVLIGVAAEVLRESTAEKKVAAMFVDSAFGAPIVERSRTLSFDNVHEVSFGSPSPDYHDANWRAYMWRQMKDWLAKGAIPDEEQLALQICLPGYHINLVLESKIGPGAEREGKHHPMMQTRSRSPSRST